MNTPFPILPNLPPFQILSNPPLSPPTPTPTVLSVVLSLWLNGWSRHIWCAILLNDNRDLHMSSLGTLVPEGPRCAFYATKQGVKVPEVWHILWFFTGTQILYHTHTHTHTHARTHTHTHTHTHTQGPVDWHAHINIYLHHQLCAHSSYLFTLIDSMNNSLISKIYFPQWVFFSKTIHS